MGRSATILSFITVAVISLLFFNGCYKEVPIVEINSPDGAERILRFDLADGMVDRVDHTIMFTIGGDTLPSFSPVINFSEYNSIRFKGMELMNGERNDLGEIVTNQPYQVIIQLNQQVDTFSCIFTSLPLIHVMTYEEIPDEPKVLSWFEMQYCHNQESDPAIIQFKTQAGIEIRGGSSTRYDKKSYGFELWEDGSTKDYSASLLGMRYGEDWILDAMYIDDLRMRNKISFELWEKISSTPDEDQMHGIFPGIHCEFVELFINNRYSGLYCLNEKLDEHILQFTRNQYELGGVMYKAIDWADGSTSFEIYNSDPPDHFLWDGWEIIYPEHENAWNPLAELRNFVVHSSDASFKDEIVTLIDLENAIEYYLFMNLLLAYDNTGKNTYLARYSEQSPFFIMPWDIEASWGRMWDGADSNTWGIVYNNLFKRLIETDAEEFNDRLCSRWDEYRETLFHEDSLMLPIGNYYTLLKNSGAIERENTRWPDSLIDFDQEYLYISEWLEARLDYLDGHFD